MGAVSHVVQGCRAVHFKITGTVKRKLGQLEVGDGELGCRGLGGELVGLVGCRVVHNLFGFHEHERDHVVYS